MFHGGLSQYGQLDVNAVSHLISLFAGTAEDQLTYFSLKNIGSSIQSFLFQLKTASSALNAQNPIVVIVIV